MAVNEMKQTSEQQMRTLQFNDKVARLNKEFIRHLQEWYKQCAHYDFSNPVKSYLQHIKRLDEMYSGKATTKTVSKDPPASGRKIIKAKRRVGEAKKSNGLNISVNVSTPSGVPPRFSLGGDVSVIKPNMDVTLTLPPPKASESFPTGSHSRKRAIRGGGPDGGPETVVFRGTDSCGVSSTVVAPASTITLPKPTPGFWSSQKKDIESARSTTPSGSAEIGSKSGDLEKPTLSFPKFVVNKDDDVNKKNSFTFPSFGNTMANNASSGELKFSFGTLPQSSTEGEKREDEEEYLPPRVEIVENEEADAVFSTKCSVFKLVDKQYSKVGIGMLHLKEVDLKKSVLVRAATAIGTVWINAFMNKAMKVSVVDEKGEKIRLTYPTSEEEISTYIIRFPSAKEASRVVEDIEAAAK